MKTGIHPNYVECLVTCGCGSTFVTRATKPKINVEICSQCHPFYTGKQKLMDTGGRVERFRRRAAAAKASQAPTPSAEAGAGAAAPDAEPAPAAE